MSKKYIKLDVPFKVSPSTSFLKLRINEIEENEKSYVSFYAWMNDNSNRMVKFTFERLLCGKMTAMSGESYESSESIATIENSEWISEINKNQTKYYPNFADNFIKMKHYIFVGHDSNIEIIAENYKYEYI